MYCAPIAIEDIMPLIADRKASLLMQFFQLLASNIESLGYSVKTTITLNEHQIEVYAQTGQQVAYLYYEHPNVRIITWCSGWRRTLHSIADPQLMEAIAERFKHAPRLPGSSGMNPLSKCFYNASVH